MSLCKLRTILVNSEQPDDIRTAARQPYRFTADVSHAISATNWPCDFANQSFGSRTFDLLDSLVTETFFRKITGFVDWIERFLWKHGTRNARWELAASRGGAKANGAHREK